MFILYKSHLKSYVFFFFFVNSVKSNSEDAFLHTNYRSWYDFIVFIVDLLSLKFSTFVLILVFHFAHM